MLHIPVLVLGVAATIAFLILRVKKGGLPAAVAKTCASVMFVLTGIAAAMDSMPYFKEPVIGLSKFNPWVMLFIAGLVCAVLGDLFLDLKYTYLEDSDAHTFLGFSFFIATQVFYFMAMQNVFLWKNDPKFIYIPFGVAVIFVLCVIFGEKKILKVTFGKFKAISAVYSGILSFTTAFAVCCMISSGFKPGAIMVAVGEVLFLISDLILSGTYFGVGKNTKKDVILNHVFYYAAQFVISAAIAQI